MTLLLTGYKSKKELKASVGKPLRFDISYDHFGEYKDVGTIYAAHRPQITGLGGREFFAQVQMQNGKIVSVK